MENKCSKEIREWISLIVPIILTIIIIFLTWNQLSLSESIRETNKELYLINKKAEIDISVPQRFLEVHRNDIVRRTIKNEPTNYVVLRILNMGKSPSGFIRVKMNTPWIADTYVDFPSLSFGEHAEDTILLTTKECYLGETKDNGLCDCDKIPTIGKQNITFEIECPFCKEEYFDKSIEFCIYENKTKDCYS